MRNLRTLLCALLVLAAVAVVANDSKHDSKKDKDGLNYLYARDGGHQIVIGSGSLHLGHIGKLAAGQQGKFFWFEHDGSEYIIRDPATLAEIDKLFASMRALDHEHESIRRRLRPLEQEERAVEMKIDALADQVDDEDGATEATVRAVESKMRDLEMVMRRVEQRMKVIEREEERLEEKMEALEAEAERKLRPLLLRAIREGKAVKS
jgi:hypothetical protein